MTNDDPSCQRQPSAGTRLEDTRSSAANDDRRASRLYSRLVALALACLAGCDQSTPEPDAAGEVRRSDPEAQTTKQVQVDQPGRWSLARGEAELTEEQRRGLEELRAIGYASGSVSARGATGVTHHVPERAMPGLNLVVSAHRPEAAILDMNGKLLHRWRFDPVDIWPEAAKSKSPNVDYWRRVHLLPGGDLLAMHSSFGLLKLDRDSNLVWSYKGSVHHDLDVTPDGHVVVLTQEVRVLPRILKTVPMYEDAVTYLDANGNELSSLSLVELVERSPASAALRDAAEAYTYRRSADLFHTNTVQYVTESLAEGTPLADAGDLVISIRNLHLVGIIRSETRELSWHQIGDWQEQHQPELLSNGRILLFDNLGTPDRSRVLELDPTSGEVVWKYQADQPGEFFSARCGSVQRLANGNTLITESDPGRAFEVDAGGNIVWEYRNPHRAGDRRQFVATLFEVIRITDDSVSDWLPKR